MVEPELNAPGRARSGVRPHCGVVHIRHRHTERFTVVGNHLAQHGELSLVAIGVAVHIQSRPDGTVIAIKDLARRFPEGAITIGRALRELERAGYLVRTVERLPDGRRCTRTFAYECPEHLRQPQPPEPAPVRPEPAAPATAPSPPAAVPSEPEPAAEPAAADTPEPVIGEAPAATEAATLLASLRAHEPRLLLSRRDVARLAPAMATWLERGIQPDAAVRTLIADLPGGLIRRPAGLLTYRLTNWLPPALPPALPADLPGRTPPPDRPHPFQDCDGCNRPYRGPDPGPCRDCLDDAEAEAAEEAVAAAALAAVLAA